MSADPIWVSAIAAGVSAFAAVGALIFSLLTHQKAKQTAERADEIESENQVLRNEWIPLHKALKYLALDSAWSRTANDTDSQSLDERLSSIFLEALSRGNVEARGRKAFDQWSKTANASHSIEKGFWQYAFIQPFGEIVLADDSRGIAATSGEFSWVTKQQFRGVYVRQRDVLRCWLQAKDNNPKNSTYYRPLADYWNYGGSFVDHEENLELQRQVQGSFRTDC